MIRGNMILSERLSIKFILLSVIIIFIFGCQTIPRDKFENLELGVRAYQSKEYERAISLLKDYKFVRNPQIYQILADSNLKIKNYEQAFYWLEMGNKLADEFSGNSYFAFLGKNILEQEFSENLSFLEFINETANSINLDPGLLLAFIEQESTFRVNAVSRTGAVGLMQLMPNTARVLGLKVPSANDSLPKINQSHLDERFNPAKNITAAARHLSFLLKNYQVNDDEADLQKMMAAYYAGTGVVNDSIPSYCKPYIKGISAKYKKYRYNYEHHQHAANLFQKLNKSGKNFSKKTNIDSSAKTKLKDYLSNYSHNIQNFASSKERGVFLNNCAIIYEALADSVQAKNMYELALLSHESDEIYFNYSIFLYKNLHYEEAFILFDKIQNKRLRERCDLLKTSYLLKKMELQKAYEILQKDFVYYEAEYLNNLGLYYFFNNEIEKAIASLIKSLDIKDSPIIANNLLAIVYHKYFKDQSRLDFTKLNRSKYIEKKLFGLPLKSNRITSRFGWRPDPLKFNWHERLKSMDFHAGVDFAGTKRDSVYSAGDGIVSTVKTYKFGGKTIFITHDNGYYSAYMHLNKILVEQGERVKQGQVIGMVGNTGLSTASHLHFGLYDEDWKALNPLLYLPANFK